MTSPISPAPTATPTSEPRSTPRPVATMKDAETLRDRFTQVLAKRSPFSEMEDIQAQGLEGQNQTAIAGEMSLLKMEASSKDDRGAPDRLPETHSAQANNPYQTTAFAQMGNEAAGRSGPAMDATLLTQFAERLALSGVQSHQTTMTLNPDQFRVAEVRIEGQASEGLSITLKNHSDSQNSDYSGQEGHSLETLRARLLARAIPVANLDHQV